MAAKPYGPELARALIELGLYGSLHIELSIALGRLCNLLEFDDSLRDALNGKQIEKRKKKGGKWKKSS